MNHSMKNLSYTAVLILSLAILSGRLMAQSMDGEIYMPDEFPVHF